MQVPVKALGMSCLTPLLLTTPSGHERHLPDADTEARGDRPCRPEGVSASPGPRHHGGCEHSQAPCPRGLSTSVSHLLLEEMTDAPRAASTAEPAVPVLPLTESHAESRDLSSAFGQTDAESYV